MPQSREQVRPPHQRASLRQLEAAKKVTQTPWTRSVTPEVSPHISSAGIGQCPPPASKKRESVVALQERRLVTSGCGAFEPKADTPAQHGFRLLAAAEQLPGEGAAAHQPPAPRSPRPAAAAEQLPGEGAAAHQSPAPRSPRPAAAARRRGGRPRRRGGGRVPLRLLPELRGAAAGLAGLRLAGGKSRAMKQSRRETLALWVGVDVLPSILGRGRKRGRPSAAGRIAGREAWPPPSKLGEQQLFVALWRASPTLV
ncbi:unnamed protein product [Prorocentrum cordatum]|uniref:Uncharacterized protein n=1 Tax=Prorocentrum cordatum TaxID=2364126 RepID=A0ABN9PHH9_9DINO|nr:unnamed protein product [Polarella glacialis]